MTTILEHFNRLTPTEAELLAWLIEEAGEVIQAVGKIQRHGFESKGYDNRGKLATELGQLKLVINTLCDHSVIDTADITQAYISKVKELLKTPNLLHHTTV